MPVKYCWLVKAAACS